jgi:3-methyladenine DNA glycosylase AlkD
MVAVVLLELFVARLAPADLEHLERFVRDSYTWALVDGLAGDVAASINAAYPRDATVDAVVRRWAGDDDFWVRRSALLAHLKTLGRRGSFEGWDRFCGFADAMLDERQFFIRKVIGWVLREASKTHPTWWLSGCGPAWSESRESRSERQSATSQGPIATRCWRRTAPGDRES